MRCVIVLIVAVLAFGAGSVFAQRGGKAEPGRILFAKGTSSKTLTGTLKNGEEMEYIFGAAKGQIVTIRNARSSVFDFRVFSEENFPEGDFDSSPTYTFETPETGDYLLFVRKKVAGPRSSRFSLTLTIK